MQKVLEKELLLIRVCFCLFFDVELLCFILAQHEFNICTLEAESGEHVKFPAELFYEFLVDESCTV